MFLCLFLFVYIHICVSEGSLYAGAPLTEHACLTCDGAAGYETHLAQGRRDGARASDEGPRVGALVQYTLQINIEPSKPLSLVDPFLEPLGLHVYLMGLRFFVVTAEVNATFWGWGGHGAKTRTRDRGAEPVAKALKA